MLTAAEIEAVVEGTAVVVDADVVLVTTGGAAVVVVVVVAAPSGDRGESSGDAVVTVAVVELAAVAGEAVEI